jgi:hypothetical protein
MTRNLELTARAWHVADIVYDYLPRPFGAAVEILVNSLGPPLTRSDRLTKLMVTSLGSTRALPAYGLEHSHRLVAQWPQARANLFSEELPMTVGAVSTTLALL